MRWSGFRIIIIVTTCILVLFLVLPLMSVLAFAFSSTLDVLPTHPTFRWFAFRQQEILSSVFVSLLIAIPAVTLGILVSIPLAYAVARCDFRAKRLVDQMIIVPLIVPGTALGLALLQLFNTGPFRAIHPLVVLILAHSILVVPVAARPLVASLERAQRGVEEAAMVFGANSLRVFRDITLPLMSPTILVGIMLGFARSVTDFAMTLFLVPPQYVPLSIHIFNSTSLSTPQITSAEATVLLLITIVLVMVASRLTRVEQLV